jgi:hypothetical protein
MVTEKDVIEALPPQGFVRTYVIHALKQTTAPLCYHLGVGLSILAATCPIGYGTHYAGTLRANIFCLLAGRSGEDQKSSALGIGREILFQAEPRLIGQYPGSQEGLIDSLAGNPRQLIPISEFGKFLAQAQKGYFEPVKTLLADLWDCTPLQRARANDRNVRVENPRLSVLAACSIPYLEKHTLSEDWSGGFMGRWTIMYGRRERIDPDPVGCRLLFDNLVGELKRRVDIQEAGWCTGLDAQAKEVWSRWYFDIYNRKLPNNLIGIKSRAPTMARKVAMLYAWDFGRACVNQPWKISMRELAPAIKFAELHIKSIIGLSKKIADHPDARLRRSVMGAIESYQGTCTLGQVLGRLKMRKRPVVESLDALMEEGIVGKMMTTTGYVYVLRGGVSRD